MLGFLTSRVKHTGSLPTPHSTRYSSLMFKGGELTRTGRRRVHQSGEKTRTILSLVCFCFVGFSPFFWSCKVSGDGRTEFQSQAASVGPEEGGDTKKQNFARLSFNSMSFNTPFISHQPFHLSVWRHSFSSSVLLIWSLLLFFLYTSRLV